MGTLAVIGAINVDLVVSGADLPRPGETVVGGVFAQHQGGKGGNQAVAAARALGQNSHRIAMIAAVGGDPHGVAATQALGAEGVDTSRIRRVDDAATGVALIAVDGHGQNQISVASGANAHLTGDDVSRAMRESEPEVVLASLEVPASAVQAAGLWCRDHGVTFVLNPAPATADAGALLPLATHITPNEGELAAIGQVPSGIVVIETRGARGARIDIGGEVEDIAAPATVVEDTTGAGDCFNGVLAASLLEGSAMLDAVRRAVVAASLSVATAGAREGMPERSALAAALR